MADDWAAEKREFVADERQRSADVREEAADDREALATERQAPALRRAERRELDHARAERQLAADARDAATSAHDRSNFSHPLADELVEVTRAIGRHRTLDEPFQHVVMIAQRIAQHCDAVSYTVKVDDGYSTTAATSPLAEDFDEVQYRTGEGPCIDAADLGRLVISADLQHDDRWPTFTAALAGTVAHSVMSAPVVDADLDQVVFGSLNHYGTSGAPFDSDDVESAMLLSAHLGALLSLKAAHDTQTQQMQEAILTRDIIGQAKGILMSRQEVGPDEAFDILRRASQRLNRKLRDLAGDIAAGVETSTAGSQPRGSARATSDTTH